MANLQCDYLAKKNKTVCTKIYLTFHIFYRKIHLSHDEKWQNTYLFVYFKYIPLVAYWEMATIIFSLILQDIAPVPWRELVKSVPLWGLIFAQIGHDWGFFTLVTDLPKYFKDVMRFNIFEVSKLVKTGNQY